MFFVVFFFKQKTAYEMRISDWSSDVCSSDLTFPSFVAVFRCGRTRSRVGGRRLLRGVQLPSPSLVIAGRVRLAVSKFSKVQPCAAADGSRSANMPRRLAPVSVKPGRDRFYPPIERAETKAGTAGQCRNAVFLRRMSGWGWGE